MVSEILTSDRVSVSSRDEGIVETKRDALRRLSVLLAAGTNEVGVDDIEHVLLERESLQSTGVGGGVAIPHGAIEPIEGVVGAVLLCPEPIQFDAIDGLPVSILFAVVGPRRSTGAHLKTLARVSRLLRDERFRSRLLAAPSGSAAFDLIAAEEAGRPASP